ncbi:MAG TPA: NAD(P)-dependent oxidoreductase [Candidatus Dormibacteraeota bacterium]|nr:NAD(P)-dependent oxidoreductase [Candidatus Dormibacteraeota bacterium]
MIASLLPEGTDVVSADYAKLLELAARADVVIGDWWHNVHVDTAVIARLERCRLVQQPSAGYENIDAEAAAAAGIPVANAGPANAGPVAEHAVMAAIACLRFLPEAIRAAAEGEWDRQRFLDMDLWDLDQRTVGILGLGAIGEALAARLRPFGCKVIYSKRRRLDAAREQGLGVAYRDLESLLSESQVLILTLPLNDETRGILSAERLSLLPQGAVIVNVARGHLMDMDALSGLLRSGHLRGAALDVFDEEPLLHGHGLDTLPNVLLTPHIAGATAIAKRDIFLNSIANVARVCRGEEPLYVVNLPVAR